MAPLRRRGTSWRLEVMRVKRFFFGVLATVVLAAGHGPARGAAEGMAAGVGDARVVFPERVQQGSLVLGKVPPGSRVEYAGRALRTTGYGTVVFGVGRNEDGPLHVEVIRPDGSRAQARILVDPRDWPEQRVDGVPPATVRRAWRRRRPRTPQPARPAGRAR